MTGVLPPQKQRWELDPQVGLTPKAVERVSREGVSQPFDVTARNLNADSATDYDGKQIKRWAEHAGRNIAGHPHCRADAVGLLCCPADDWGSLKDLAINENRLLLHRYPWNESPPRIAWNDGPAFPRTAISHSCRNRLKRLSQTGPLP